jgi:dipeptide/tripeptide permease
MKKVLKLVRKLQFQNLSHIVCFSFLFWTIYKQGGVVIQFHTKKFVQIGWANQKAQPKTKKIKLCTFLKYLPSQPTYLPN